MPNSIQSNGPYDVCIDCEHRNVDCDGPNMIAMTMPRLVIFFQALKTKAGMSNNQISEKSGISKSTIEKFAAGLLEDAKLSTISAIFQAISGTWGQYPCAMQALREAENTDTAKLIAEIDRLREEKSTLQEDNSFLKEQLREVNKRMEERTRFMTRKDWTMAALFVMFLLSILYNVFV